MQEDITMGNARMSPERQAALQADLRLATGILANIQRMLQADAIGDPVRLNQPGNGPQSDYIDDDDGVEVVGDTRSEIHYDHNESNDDDPASVDHREQVLQNIQYGNRVDGCQMKTYIRTTRSKDGTARQYHEMPPMYFANEGQMIDHFKAEGWRLEKAQRGHSNGIDNYYLYCRHGGDSHKHHRKVLKRMNDGEDVYIQHKGYGDPASKPFCCQARLNANYDKTEMKVSYRVSVDGHNHIPDRKHFSHILAQLDPSMKVLDTIVRDAIDHRHLLPAAMMKVLHNSLALDYPHLPASERDRLHDAIGLIQRDLMKHVGSIVRKVRGEDQKLDLQFLLQSFLRDKEITALHSPRMIGMGWDYDHLASLDRIAITISTTCLLKRAFSGINQALLVDCTHSTNSAGYKILTLGTEDRWRKFHLLALAIVTEESAAELATCLRALKKHVNMLREPGQEPWSPNVVMADGSSAITAAVGSVFPEAVRLNCYFHLKKRFEDRWASSLDPKILRGVCLDISVLADARDPKQFEAWVYHFLAKWDDLNPVILSYLRERFDLGSWRSRFFWGAIGVQGLVSGRTNNSTESFHKQFKSAWLNRTPTCLSRLLGILRGPDMAANSRQGSSLDDFACSTVQDFRQNRLLKYWKAATRLFHDLPQVTEVRRGHWAPGYEDRGTLYAIEYISGDHMAAAVDGTYNPFLNRGSPGSLVYLPDNTCEILQAPPTGGACTCNCFIRFSMCSHLLYISCYLKRVVPHPVCVPVGKPTRADGLRRPKEFLKSCLQSRRPIKRDDSPQPSVSARTSGTAMVPVFERSTLARSLNVDVPGRAGAQANDSMELVLEHPGVKRPKRQTAGKPPLKYM